MRILLIAADTINKTGILETIKILQLVSSSLALWFILCCSGVINVQNLSFVFLQWSLSNTFHVLWFLISFVALLQLINLLLFFAGWRRSLNLVLCLVISWKLILWFLWQRHLWRTEEWQYPTCYYSESLVRNSHFGLIKGYRRC